MSNMVFTLYEGRAKRAVFFSIAGFSLAVLIIAGIMFFFPLGTEAAKPPTPTPTYWLVTDWPHAPVYTELSHDPGIDFELNWIALESDDGSIVAFDQNCKVAYFDAETGDLIKI